jgi:hypothetical protein
MQILKSKSKNTRGFGVCIIFHNSKFYIDLKINFNTWLIGF